MAWLNTAPVLDLPPEHRPPDPVSRMKAMENRGELPPLPPVRAEHMVRYLMAAGPVEYNAMGRAPLSWREIGAWSEQTGTPLNAWEAETLRRLSAEYLGETVKAEKPDCPAPWEPEPEKAAAERAKTVASGLRLALSSYVTHQG